MLFAQNAGPDNRWDARNEMETILGVSNHANVIRVVAMDPTLPTMPIMMEAGSMDLFDVMEDININMRTKIRLLLETARGLSHMHARGKVHRDVKPGNIVVVGGDDETAPLTAKVADFGMACDIGAPTYPKTGSLGYLPVENLDNTIAAGPDGDAFSFGVVMLNFFLKLEIWENNVFAHSLLLTEEEKVEMKAIERAGWDSEKVVSFQLRVTHRVMEDSSFKFTMLVPERLDDSVPHKPRVNLISRLFMVI
eukprot:jgi/Undpi1/3739/HiC_scaffold_16.g07108.m1